MSSTLTNASEYLSQQKWRFGRDEKVHNKLQAANKGDELLSCILSNTMK